MSVMRWKTKQDNVIRQTEINYIQIQMRLVSISKEQNWLLCNNMLNCYRTAIN